MDDDTSEWWNSEESKNFMNSLLEVMESYTPDGYRFGPKSGTADLYGYWESKPGQTTLFHLLFSLESGYEWGKGLSHEKTDAFYKEIKRNSWRGIRHGQNRLYITGHVSCKRKDTPVRASDGNKRLL